MNAIELLKKDHKTVKSLFESFEKAKEQEDVDSKRSLFTSIKEELDAHTRVEEEIFYPAFDRAAGEENDDDKELVLEAGEEHQQVKVLLAELSQLDADDETFDAKMKVMKDNIDHHVEEEEGEMFPHAQKQLSSDELEQLGQQMEALKEQIQEEGPQEAVDTRKGRRVAQRGRSARAATANRRSGGAKSSGSGGSRSSSRSGGSKSARSGSSGRTSSTGAGSSRRSGTSGRSASSSRSGSGRTSSASRSRSSSSRSGASSGSRSGQARRRSR